MNSSKYLMNCYVPTKPTVKKFHDLHTRLQEMTFNEVVDDPKKHFENVYINNFDLIHHKSRGDPLEYSEKLNLINLSLLLSNPNAMMYF